MLVTDLVGVGPVPTHISCPPQLSELKPWYFGGPNTVSWACGSWPRRLVLTKTRSLSVSWDTLRWPRLSLPEREPTSTWPRLPLPKREEGQVKKKGKSSWAKLRGTAVGPCMDQEGLE